MIEKLLQWDTTLFIFLNGLGSENYDGFWLCITKQFHWTPFFILILYLVYKQLDNWKNFVLLLVTIALLITVTDQFTNCIKATFQRLRPCSDPQINGIIRVVKSSATYSFFSGHAANSMASTTLVFLLIRKHYKYAFLLFTFPLVFAYSRIYLGLHFPLDIASGYAVGTLFGIIFYHLYLKFLRKFDS